MEEPHRIHKEPAWGWIGVILSRSGERTRTGRLDKREPAHQTPRSEKGAISGVKSCR